MSIKTNESYFKNSIKYNFKNFKKSSFFQHLNTIYIFYIFVFFKYNFKKSYKNLTYRVNVFYSILQLIFKILMWNKSRIIYYVNNWIYTTNHKRIAVNYFWFVILSGIIGMVLATVIRLELAYPGVGIFAGDSLQYLSMVTAHGVIMVFFMIMPLLFGAYGNFLLPTQLGVHDVAFPRLNSAAFWFLPAGLIMLGQLVCIDRRYQRMNCFNIREVQSLLKRKFFVDLINNYDHRNLLNNSMIGLKYKTNDLNFINSNTSLFYNYGLVLNDKNNNNSYFFNKNNSLNTDKYLNSSTFFYKTINRNENFTKFSYISYIFNNCVNIWSYVKSPSKITNWDEFTEKLFNYFFSYEPFTVLIKNVVINPIINPIMSILRLIRFSFITVYDFIYNFFNSIRIFFVSCWRYVINLIHKTLNYLIETCSMEHSFLLKFVHAKIVLENKFRDKITYEVDYQAMYNHIADNIFNYIKNRIDIFYKKISINFYKLDLLNRFLINCRELSEFHDRIAKLFYAYCFYPVDIRLILKYDASPYSINLWPSLCKNFYDFLVINYQKYINPNNKPLIKNYKFSDLFELEHSDKLTPVYKFTNFSHIKKINYDSNIIYFYNLFYFTFNLPIFFINLIKEVHDLKDTLHLWGDLYYAFINWYLSSLLESNLYLTLPQYKSNFRIINKILTPFFKICEMLVYIQSFFNNLIPNILLNFQNFIVNFVTPFYNLYSETVQDFRLDIFEKFHSSFIYYNFVFIWNKWMLILDDENFFLKNLTIFIKQSYFQFKSSPVNLKTFSKKSEYFNNVYLNTLTILSNEEVSNISRNQRFSNLIFKYDYKSGNYFIKLYSELYTYLFPTILNLTMGLRTSPWFFSTSFIEKIINNQNNLKTYMSDVNGKKITIINNKFEITNTFFNFFLLLDNNNELLNKHIISFEILNQKFYKMFLTSSMQQRIYSNWRNLKFTREAWRCKLLSARHQKTLYKRYVNENGILWSLERNAKDLLPGWAMITPFSSRTKFTAIGKVDIGLMGVLLVLNSSIISGANFLVTYRYLSTLNNRKMRDTRAFFTEGVLIASWMMIAANPMLVIAIIMLLSDRHWQTSFFDYSGGGDTIMFQHMFWFFGHPEVYIIMIPVFGFTNTIISYYLKKRISARASLLYSMYTIAFLGFFVWGHHMYMVGLAHTTRMLFSTLTVMISVPAATKLMHWCVTLTNSSFTMELPFLFILTFIFFFVSGGISGMCVAHTGMDILFHDTFYVIGHFHVMLAGAAMFGSFGAFYFYFPAIFGVKYSRIYAYLHYTYYLLGQFMTVAPMFWLGYAGMPRRVLDYPMSMGGWHSVISAGHLLSVAGLIAFFFMIFDSLRQARAVIRNTFGINRYNTCLNFYLYEISRSIHVHRKSFHFFKYIQPYSLKLNKLNYNNYEYLETILFSYKFYKKM